MKLSLIVFFFTLSATAQEKKICVTIDDLPVVALSFKTNEARRLITEKILSALRKHSIAATGFVNEYKLYADNTPDTSQTGLLNRWLDSGMELGNHGFSHLDYNQVNEGEYFADIIKGEKFIKQLSVQYGRNVKYFRHPYLHTGESKAKADSLHAFLTGKGYKEAPVTIDDADWIFALAYDSAMINADTILMKSTGAAYVLYMEKKLHYYEAQAKKLFGRAIQHILLIHANAINAGYLDQLATMYEKNGYGFVSLGDALNDQVYATKITVYGRWGISWLHRWAMSMGKKGNFFKDEPEVPPDILKLAKVSHE